MFTVPSRPHAKYQQAGDAATGSSAQFRLYPQRDASGRLQWAHWADLTLASAWAQRAVAQLDSLVSTFGAKDVDASLFESPKQPSSAQRSPFARAFAEALQSVVFAFHALNVPPMLWVSGARDTRVELIISRVVATPRRTLDVHSRVQSVAQDAGMLETNEALAAMWRSLSLPALHANESVVVDTEARREVSRGDFDHAASYVRAQPGIVRARLAWWGRRPWRLGGYDPNDELEFIGQPSITMRRERWLAQLREVRQIAQVIASAPWPALKAQRSNVLMENDRLARQWGLSRGLVHPGTDPAVVREFLDVVQGLANTRSEELFEAARRGTVESFRGTGESVTRFSAAVSRTGAAALGIFNEFLAFLVQILPREWIALAENPPPPLPLPTMLSGDESVVAPPSLVVPAPAGFDRAQVLVREAPAPIDTAPVMLISTMTANAAQTRVQTSVARRPPIAMEALLNGSARNSTSPETAENATATSNSLFALEPGRGEPRTAIGSTQRAAVTVGIGAMLGVLVGLALGSR
jgi:hypothetical protein